MRAGAKEAAVRVPASDSAVAPRGSSGEPQADLPPVSRREAGRASESALGPGLPALRVVRVLEQLGASRGWPEEIRVDHGPEFVSRVMGAWCEQRKILLRFIDPGTPMQNGYVKSFNGRFRDECLNANWFLNLAQLRTMIESWR